MRLFFLSLITPALWALSNHFDKFIVSRYFKDATLGAMMVFSALIAIAVLPVALLFQERAFEIGILTPCVLVCNGCLYLIAVLLYLVALRTSEVSMAVPIFQLIPVLSFTLAYCVLGETLSTNQIVGGVLITVGALAISIEPRGSSRLTWRVDVLGLMSLSSLLFAIQFLTFKLFAIQLSFWTVLVWESIGFISFGVFLLVFVRSYRRDFMSVFGNGGLAPCLHLTGELIYLVGKISFNYVSLLIPITLAWIGVGFQPLFILIYSVILTVFLPHICKENVLGSHFLHKAIAIAVMLLGTYILNR